MQILGYEPQELRRLLALRDEIKRLQARYPRQPAVVLEKVRFRMQIATWLSPRPANDDEPQAIRP